MRTLPGKALERMRSFLHFLSATSWTSSLWGRIWLPRVPQYYFYSDSKESACNAGDLGSIPGSGRSPGEGNVNPFQYPCLENSMDRGAYGLQSMGSQRAGHKWATNIHIHIQERNLKKNICICTHLKHFAVCLKLIQHCKSNLLQWRN